jgi:hypothetical protein
MAKCLDEGTLVGGESAWAPSQRAYEQDDCQHTSESRTAPIQSRTDGKILMRQNQGLYSLVRPYIHSQNSRPHHQDCKRHLPRDYLFDFPQSQYQFPASVNRDGEKTR